MGQITLQDVQKSFGPVHIIKGADLDVADGSFVVFVGPSGCGKTTLLRLIAGLEDVSGGKILIDGKNVVDTPPAKRGLSMVFQSYALYPHMSVRGNIGFGLKMAGLSKDETNRKVEAAAATLNLTPYLDRKPRELSGGQRQRVAIGRAIVREPKAFLFDEPLSNLDAALRVQMRIEVTRLQKQLGTTAIYVTHDQVEAMGMGDRIAVIDHGVVRQVGTPTEIYDDPADRFVATFVGTPPMNIVAKNGGYLGFRPENFLPKDMMEDSNFAEFKFRVDRSEYLGSERIVYGAMEGFDPKQVITAKLPPAHVADEWIRPGEWHPFAVRNGALRNFDKDGKRTSRH
jgi:ABC-type sugar transport system ATPase subunit